MILNWLVMVLISAKSSILTSSDAKNYECIRNDDCSSSSSAIQAFNDEKLYLKRSCLCDDDCYKYGDCCADKVYSQMHNDHSFQNYRQFKCVLEQRVCQADKPSLFVYSVGDCSADYHDDDVTRKKCEASNHMENVNVKTPNNEDVFLEWPFYSNLTNTTYNNIYCGLCNGEKKERLQPWNAAFRCDPSINKQIKNVSAHEKMSEIKASCVFVKWMSDYMQFRYCRRDLISKCLKPSGDTKQDQMDHIKCTKGDICVRVLKLICIF